MYGIIVKTFPKFDRYHPHPSTWTLGQGHRLRIFILIFTMSIFATFLIWFIFGMNKHKILKYFRKEKHNFRQAVLSIDRSCIKTNTPNAFSSSFQGANYVNTHFIADKYTHKVRINVISMSKKLKFYNFMVSLYFGIKFLKKWEKNSPSWGSPCRIGKISPSGSDFQPETRQARPWLKFKPLGWDFPILATWILIFLHIRSRISVIFTCNVKTTLRSWADLWAG